MIPDQLSTLCYSILSDQKLPKELEHVVLKQSGLTCTFKRNEKAEWKLLKVTRETLREEIFTV